MIYGNFNGNTRYDTTETLDGGRFSNVPWVSALVNGKGRFYDPEKGKIKGRYINNLCRVFLQP